MQTAFVITLLVDFISVIVTQSLDPFGFPLILFGSYGCMVNDWVTMRLYMLAKCISLVLSANVLLGLFDEVGRTYAAGLIALFLIGKELLAIYLSHRLATEYKRKTDSVKL